MPNMYKRYWIRKQNRLLIFMMRGSYGAGVFISMFVNINIPGTLIGQIMHRASLDARLLLSVLMLSALMLVCDVIVEMSWPKINKRWKNRLAFYKMNSNRYLVCNELVRKWCAFSNRHRHWFYLPTAFCALFIVPYAKYIGVPSFPLVKILYIWFFVWGIACALLEGAINNEK